MFLRFSLGLLVHDLELGELAEQLARFYAIFSRVGHPLDKVVTRFEDLDPFAELDVLRDLLF